MSKKNCIPVHINSQQTHTALHEHFPLHMKGHAQLFMPPKHVSAKKKIYLEIIEILVNRPDLFILKCRIRASSMFFGAKSQVVTLKIKSNAADIYDEYLHFKDFHACQMASLFPEVYFFATFHSIPKGDDGLKSWGCIAMEFFHLSLVDLFFAETHLKKKTTYELLVKNFELDFASISNNSNGMVICTDSIYSTAKRDLLASLLVTSLQLLRTLHQAHWIHGDSHLGNFMVNVCTLRVVMIDTERSFQSTSPMLKLSDMQELFAHAVRLSVETPYNGKWNMKDFTGVATLLHPLFNNLLYNKLMNCSPVSIAAQAGALTHLHMKQKILENFKEKKSPHLKKKDSSLIFFLLPVCNCFVRHDHSDRVNGCIFCNSDIHLLASELCQFDAIWKTITCSLFGIAFLDLRQTILDARILQRAIYDTGYQIIEKNRALIWKPVRHCIIRGEISFTILDGEPPLDWVAASFQRLYYFPMFQAQNADFSSVILQDISNIHSSASEEVAFLSSYVQQKQWVDFNVRLFRAWQRHLLEQPKLDFFWPPSSLPPPPGVHGAC